MTKIPPRMVIYTRDVENITGRKRSTAQRIMQKIRTSFSKGRNDFITVEEFCSFMKLEETKVREYL